MKVRIILPLMFTATVLLGQTSQPITTTVTAVPRLVRINSTFRPVNGATAAVESATMSIYAAETGGTALWQEVQNVGVDGEGRYSVLLGSTRNEGLPVELFTAGEPRWLGVQFQRPGEVEQPRVLMASVPYALKAVDADTLGGQPASAYLLAPASSASSASAGSTTNAAGSIAPARLTPKFTSGTTNHIAKFVSNLDLGDSVMVESIGKIGIGTSNPAAALEISTVGGGAQFTNTAANNFTFNTFSSPGNASYLYNFGNAYPSSGRFVQSSTLLDAGSILSLSASNHLRFYTNGSNERMRIDSSGNVGIGTLTPVTRLDVAGDISLFGSLFKGGVRLLYGLGDNTALGFNTLLNNTGGANTAVGSSALASNTTGFHNTASGDQALLNNTTGSENTANGVNALAVNTTGYSNTASGFDAMFNNTTGADNTASGYQALFANTIGTGNVASGFQALFSNTTGSNNSATGLYAMYSNVGGSQNTATGDSALLNNTSGAFNAAYGDGALYVNTTGNYNIALGHNAGTYISAGNNNIMIGSLGDDDDHTIRIGDSQTKTYIAGIQGAHTGALGVNVIIDAYGQLGTVQSSRRYKEDIHDMADASSKLLQLRPVTYRYKQAYANGSKPIDYGLIAEEVADVYPDLVVTNKDGQIETVQYQKLTPMLLNEVQKLHQDAERLHNELQIEHEQNRLLESRLAVLEAMLSSKATATSSQLP